MDNSGNRRVLMAVLLVVAAIGLVIALTAKSSGNSGYGPHYIPVYGGGSHDDGGGFDGDGGGGFHGGGDDG